MLPPAHYIGAVEAIPRHRPVRSGRLRRPGPLYDAGRRRLLRPVRPTRRSASCPVSARPPGSTRPRCWRSRPSAAATRTGPGKKDPLDALVWRAERPGEPAWESRFGRGPARLARRVRGHRHRAAGIGLRRPGRRLRPGVPAPRDERLARPGGLRRPAARFARVYAHAGMVGLDGEKMSKSLGNLVFVSRLRGRRRGPDGRPAGAAGSPLPRRLGVDRARAGRRPHPPDPLAHRH